VQASSYEDTTGYSNYNQASTFQDYQLPQQPKPQQHQPAAPAQPKYSAAANVAPQQLPAAAPHAGYNAGYGHGSSAYGSTASPAPSTTAPLSGGSNQVSYEIINLSPRNLFHLCVCTAKLSSRAHLSH